MTTWTKIETARIHGWNVRKTEGGWQVAKLTIEGWIWKPFTFPTKMRALRHCFIAHTA